MKGRGPGALPSSSRGLSGRSYGLAHSSLLPLLLARLRIDVLAALSTLVLALALLGTVFVWFDFWQMTLNVGPDKLGRWVASSLPVATLGVFLLGYKRFAPWFSGILASVVLWMVPGLSPLPRFILFIVLAVLLGGADVFLRRKAAQRNG